MRISGNGNDGLMMLVPVGMAVVVGVILFGGPANAVEAINEIVGGIVYDTTTMVKTWF